MVVHIDAAGRWIEVVFCAGGARRRRSVGQPGGSAERSERQDRTPCWSASRRATGRRRLGPGARTHVNPIAVSTRALGGSRYSRNSGTIQNGFWPRATRSKLSKALRQRFQ